MTKTELTRDMRSYTGAGVITLTQLAKYLGYKETKYVKAKFLNGLQPVTEKKYFIPDVVDRLMERRYQ